uniref:hypothetical protein n=1 Tax=Alicyclobacillus acidocaldarius TaxID=405212 RepID=UPI0013053649|nr:hypothetical protein [Alicyclobacillus acidocaldarius]
MEQARQKGLLEGKRQCVDATVISANAAVQNRKELLRAARRRLFRAWERIDAKTAAETANQLQEEYTNASEPDLAKEEKLTQHLLDAVDAAGHTGVKSSLWTPQNRELLFNVHGSASMSTVGSHVVSPRLWP